MQFIAVALVVFLVSVWVLMRVSRKKTTATISIQKRTVLLDSQQREFKKRLVEACEQDFDICPRVHLADLVSIKFKADDKVSQSLQQKITTISVDFVLLEPVSGRVACVLQLDRDHETSEQYALLEKTCQQAKLALVHFSTDNALESAQIRKQVMSALEPTINLDDDNDSDGIKVYLEPATTKSDNEHKIVLETM